MGLHINIAVSIRELLRRHGASGSVLTLGVQDTSFTESDLAAVDEGFTGCNTGPMRAADFLQHCGFSTVHSLDRSAYEGAEIVFDLNEPSIPEHLAEAYDCVLNGGTLEHVFHIPNALTSITRMLKVGGLVVHIVPVHNWVDHGFVQISPTLMHDYYDCACFETLEAVGLLFDPRDQAPWHVFSLQPGVLGQGLCGIMDARAMLAIFVARKTKHALASPIPLQAMYRTDAQPPAPRWFPPYTMSRGRRGMTGEPMELTLGPFQSDGGSAWRCALPPSLHEGDDLSAPVRSELMLFEDTLPLGPAHSQHITIREIGRGSYSHWGTTLILSTSDNSNPNENGRTYRALIPIERV